MAYSEIDIRHMRHALELAQQGAGFVEPNPMVGCVVARDDRVLGTGWHQAYGQAHAEVNALQQAGDHAKDATVYVTLEPCCHTGQTPPCTEALIAAGVGEIVIAAADPFPKVSGNGLQALKSAGIRVRQGLLEAESRALNAPYLRLTEQRRPWIIAKWAMTLDGKIATHTGDSQWISNEAARQRVHQLRGRMDAIVVGSQTAIKDDPLLNARPAGARVALRVVVSSTDTLSSESQLVKTAAQFPTMLAVGPEWRKEHAKQLRSSNVEVWQSQTLDRTARFHELMMHFGQRRFTNVLVEGGGDLLGNLFDQALVDEVHIFIGPRIVGGAQAVTAVKGRGFATIADSRHLENFHVERLEDDLYIHGRLSGFSEG